MVDSLSTLKVKTETSGTDESEVVACIAAVALYLKTEEEEALCSQSTKSTRGALSGWGNASVLEGTKTSAPIHHPEAVRRKSLWNYLGSFFLIFLTMNMCVPSALAQTMVGADEDEAIADEPSIVYASADRPSFQSFGRTASVPAQLNSYERRLSQNGKISIRVALSLNVSDVHVDTIDGADLIDLKNGKQVATLNPLSQWKLAARVLNGAPVVALLPRREADKSAIALGEKPIATNRSVAFLPTTAPMPPIAGSKTPIKGGFQQIIIGSASPLPAAPVPTVTSANVPPQSAVTSADDSAVPSEFAEEADEEVQPQPPETSYQPPSGIECGVLIIPDRSAPDGSSYVFSMNGRMYRGALWLRPTTVKDKNGASVTRMSAINVLDLEEYLMGVLPSEMPSSWPRESLKAQAIAARSYALANLGKYASQGFDVKATVLDQAYRGVSAETHNTNQAVAETTGIVMKHNGQIVPAFFHSTSAGHTDVSEHVWSRELPYLKSVPDVDTKSKFVLWERKFGMPQIQSAIGKDVGTILGLFPIHRSPSGRVKNLLVVGKNGATLVAGTTVRQVFALPSTNFSIINDPGGYIFKGQGFGHGLGMSQWGARTLAEHGYNAGQILTYYYKDVTFDQILGTKAL